MVGYEETFDKIDLFKFWLSEGWNYRRKYNKRMLERPDEYKERLRHEYETIRARQGFVDYFCIVSDLVRWAKSQGIAVGPGRGSAAGSLVCYLLRITEIDPLQFPMLFERFLDPTRTDPPDIDIDFDDGERDRVFAYAAEKYGHEKVANIGTFTRYKARNSLDDIARVYRLPPWKIDAVKGKLIERAEGHPRAARTLEDTYNTFEDVGALVRDTPELKFAPRLEGNIRTFGVHAAGMIISSVDLNEICATYDKKVKSNGGQTAGAGGGRSGAAGNLAERQAHVAAFDKYDAAYLGMLKIDILGLTTMGTIAEICRLASISLEELYRVPLDDEEVLAAFRKGDTLGVFQFEGNTTRRILKQVKPTVFMHLSDVNALSRPGADDAGYIFCKNSIGAGRTEHDYPHDVMRQHLSWTYGVVVYEEQILMILRDLGGFAPAELNRMRKVIHDKLGSTAFNEYCARFVKGAGSQGLSEATAQSIWDGMVGASGYAFNIAHSVSYAHIGYWTMWLKVHYPAEFFAANLLKCSEDVRRGKLIQEAQRHGIEVRPPNLLLSQANWTLSWPSPMSPEILAGFNVIPGIGPKTCASILKWRGYVPLDLVGADERVWDDLIEVKGIGKETISSIKRFCNADDPFGVEGVARTLNSVRMAFDAGELIGVPRPTHSSVDLPMDRTLVCYMGIPRKRKYYDAVEKVQMNSTVALSYEEALSAVTDPHLLKYVMIEVEDEWGELVKVWVNRWQYPKFEKKVESIKLNKDVVIVQGKASDFGGISMQTRELVVIEV